jgi:hypothetical protein
MNRSDYAVAVKRIHEKLPRSPPGRQLSWKRYVKDEGKKKEFFAKEGRGSAHGIFVHSARRQKLDFLMHSMPGAC